MRQGSRQQSESQQEAERWRRAAPGRDRRAERLARQGAELARRHGRRRRTRRSGWVDRLATRLDVSVTTLRSALQDVREATPAADRHADLVSALAVGLGRSEAQVRAALEGGRTQRPRGRDGLADALARELGLDAATVRAAVDEVQDARRARGRLPGARGLGQALAEELGVDVDRLRDALRAVDGPKRARRGDAQGIATALNVDVAQVRADPRGVPRGRGQRAAMLAATRSRRRSPTSSGCRRSRSARRCRRCRRAADITASGPARPRRDLALG